jgi:hypothetical protein
MHIKTSKSTLFIEKFSHFIRFARTQVIVYNFTYTIFPNIPSNIIIQQPTAAQYAAICGAVGIGSSPVTPYTIDICGYFPSISDGNVQLIMQAVSSYYTAHRVSSLGTRKSKKTK